MSEALYSKFELLTICTVCYPTGNVVTGQWLSLFSWFNQRLTKHGNIARDSYKFIDLQQRKTNLMESVLTGIITILLVPAVFLLSVYDVYEL